MAWVEIKYRDKSVFHGQNEKNKQRRAAQDVIALNGIQWGALACCFQTVNGGHPSLLFPSVTISVCDILKRKGNLFLGFILRFFKLKSGIALAVIDVCKRAQYQQRSDRLWFTVGGATPCRFSTSDWQRLTWRWWWRPLRKHRWGSCGHTSDGSSFWNALMEESRGERNGDKRRGDANRYIMRRDGST